MTVWQKGFLVVRPTASHSRMGRHGRSTLHRLDLLLCFVSGQNEGPPGEAQLFLIGIHDQAFIAVSDFPCGMES